MLIGLKRTDHLRGVSEKEVKEEEILLILDGDK